MSKAAGYSGTPLARKLGIKPAEEVVALNAPANYKRLLVGLPPGAKIVSGLTSAPAFIHLFLRDRATLRRDLSQLRATMQETGTLWISWPKKSSGVVTDVSEEVVREEALPLGFVDVKVCAVDETWSGLKLVVRRSERGKDS